MVTGASTRGRLRKLFLPSSSSASSWSPKPSVSKPPSLRQRRGTLEDEILEPVHLRVLLPLHLVEDGDQLLHHQRYRSIDSRQTRRGVDELLHSVPLYPPVRPDASETVRPRSAGFRQTPARRAPAGEWGPDRRRVVLLAPPLPGPCLGLSPWWFISARAIATLQCSCRGHCPRRRCHLLAAPVSLAA